MGIPFSKQINVAFTQVTPLVAAGFEVLQTTKNITFLLAAMQGQVLTVLFLGLILVTLLALIITVSPDLEYERQALVTPAVRWIADRLIEYGKWVNFSVWTMIIGTSIGALGGWYVTEDAAETVESQAGGPETEDTPS